MITKTVNSPKSERDYQFTYDAGANLKDAEAKFGHDAVFRTYERMVATDLSNSIRAMLNNGKTDEEIAAYIASYKVAAGGGGYQDPETIVQNMAKSNPELLKKLLQQVAGK